MKNKDRTKAAKIPMNQDHSNPISPDKIKAKNTFNTLNNESFSRTMYCLFWEIRIEPKREYNVLNKQKIMNESE
jgi:hypothetical protein